MVAQDLDLDSLRALSQVCSRLNEVAGSLYLSLVGFTGVDMDGWLLLEAKHSAALLVWRRSRSFNLPRVIWVFTCGTNERLFNAATLFVESLRGTQVDVMPEVHLSMHTSLARSSPYQPSSGLTSFLDTVNSTGCTVLHCDGASGFLGCEVGVRGSSVVRESHINTFRINTPLLFLPAMVSFTLTTLRSAPLHTLALTNTMLAPAQWPDLLEELAIPTLSVLEIDRTCPVHTLVHFLAGHQVRELSVNEHPHHPPSPELKRRRRHRTSISALTRLDAPSSVIIALAHSADLTTPLRELHVRLQQDEGVNLFSEVLSCTQYLPDVESLKITLPVGAEPTAFAVPDVMHTSTAREVCIRVANRTADPNIMVNNSFSARF